MNIEEKTETHCHICAEPFTDVKRKETNCPKCEFPSCIQCLKRQVLSNNDPMCMNPDCRAIFPNSYLFTILPRNFIKGEYRKHRSEVILEQELSLMKSTMPYVEAKMKAKDAAIELEKKISEQKKLNQEISNLRQIVLNGNNFNSINTDDKDKQKQTFLKKCPINDCKGFLNSSYKCEICKIIVCSKCFQPKDEGHECDEDMVKTAELLRKDTKSCPNCSEMIHKIEGCNQMFCTNCGTGFDWKTLRIVTGIIHNPHYFEYQSKNGGRPRSIGDIPCGGLPNIPQIYAKFSKIFDIEYKIIDDFMRRLRRQKNLRDALLKKNVCLEQVGMIITEIEKFMQFNQHIRGYEIPYLEPGTIFSRNLNKRIQYMMNDISKETLKASITKKELESLKKVDNLQIFITCATLLEEQIRKFVDSNCKKIDDIEIILSECYKILDYINSCFKDQALIYQRKMPKIIIPKRNLLQCIDSYSRIDIGRTSTNF